MYSCVFPNRKFLSFFLNQLCLIISFCFLSVFRLQVEINKKEVNELKCLERKLQKQSELIKGALNELGCEEVPPGCDLSIDNQNFSNSSEQVNLINVSFLYSLTYLGLSILLFIYMYLYLKKK